MVRDPVASANERVKLIAAFLNALAIGRVGSALVRPLIEGAAFKLAFAVAWGAAALALHGAAHYILRYIRKEES